jgi:hypothetical protein
MGNTIDFRQPMSGRSSGCEQFTSAIFQRVLAQQADYAGIFMTLDYRRLSAAPG